MAAEVLKQSQLCIRLPSTLLPDPRSRKGKELEQTREGETQKGGPVNRVHGPLSPQPPQPICGLAGSGGNCDPSLPQASQTMSTQLGELLRERGGEGSGYTWSNNLKPNFLLASVVK